MTRGRFRYDPETQKVIPIEDWRAKYGYGERPKQSDLPAPMIIGPLKEYRSMITGEMITDRAQHREHLKQHNKIEVGNEYGPLERPSRQMRPVGQDVKDAIEQLRAGRRPPPDEVPDGTKGLAPDNLRIYKP